MERYAAISPVNLRAEPSNGAEVLAIVEEGDAVRRIGRRGGWLRVEYTDRAGADYAGWVHGRNLRRAEVPPQQGGPSARDGG